MSQIATLHNAVASQQVSYYLVFPLGWPDVVPNVGRHRLPPCTMLWRVLSLIFSIHIGLARRFEPTPGTSAQLGLPSRFQCGPILTSKCASRQNSVHFFDVEWQSNRQKVARARGSFNIFTQNVLRATTACTFSTPQLPKVAPSCGVLYIFTPDSTQKTECGPKLGASSWKEWLLGP